MSKRCILIISLPFILTVKLVMAQTSSDTQQKLTAPIRLANQQDTVTVFFDPSKLEPKDMELIYSAFALVATKNNSLNTAIVKPNQNINRIIKENYNIVNEKNYHISEVLKTILSDVNNLDQAKTLSVGKKFLLPRLPVKPEENSESKFTQYFDFYNNKVYLSKTLSLASSEPSNLATPIAFDKAALFAAKFSQEDFEIFKNILTEKRFAKSYGKGLISNKFRTVDLNYLKSITALAPTLRQKVRIDTMVTKILKDLDKKNFGTYYVFDSFNGASSHGDKVMDVVDLRFTEYGLDTTGIAIKRVPSNYFDNQIEGKEILKKYYALEGDIAMEDIEAKSALSILMDPTFTKELLLNCNECIPEIYLRALFGYHYRLKPDVISSSFWANTYNGSIMPRIASSTTNLITAALNDKEDIDDMMQVPLEEDSRTISMQPLFDYYNLFGKDGCMIIGNRMSKGNFAGSYGTRISTLGQGTGWIGKKIKESDVGTSFATPDIATKLFIAKAYWKSQGESLISTEARIRVLLATDLDTALVGRFSSGGTLNMIKLLQTNNYVELNNGSIAKIDDFDFGKALITYNDGETDRLRRLVSIKDPQTGRKTRKDGVSGLSFCDGNFYSFNESLEEVMWEKIEVKQLSLNYKIGDQQYNISSPDEFAKTIKQIVILKNKN